MICVLRVIEGPAKGMKCWLKGDQRITVGRLSTSDFAIAADHHMSRTHLVIEGTQTAFRVRDAGSSNGTYVNDSKVAMMELCVGDRVRAGTTVFRVEFEEEQGGSTRRRVELPFESLPIPERSLSAADVDFVGNDETKRFSIDQIPQLPPRGGESAQAIANKTSPNKSAGQASIEAPQPVSMASAQSSDASIDKSYVDIRVIPASFLTEFPLPIGNMLWRQLGNGSKREARQIIDQLSLVDWDAKLSLIVNRSQIEGEDCGTLDFSLSTGESRRLTETLYLLQSKSQPIVLDFYRRCLNKDAAVCVASPKPLKNEWIAESIDALSYPSMLFELVSKSAERAGKLAQGTHFLLFEPNTSGELCLLRRD
jgi:pSer/pThr/pTyr-binding forkhead associated (FHA) protein